MDSVKGDDEMNMAERAMFLESETGRILLSLPRPGRKICGQCANVECLWRNVGNSITEECLGFQKKENINEKRIN